MGNCPLRPSSLLQWPGEERRKSSKVSNMFQSWKCAILPAALWASVMSTAVDSVSVSITSRPRRLGGNEDFVLPLISCHILHFLLLSAAHEIMKLTVALQPTNSAQARIKSVEDFKSFLSHSVFISWCSKMFPDSSELKLRPRRCLVTNTQVHDWSLNIIRHHSTALTQHCF